MSDAPDFGHKAGHNGDDGADPGDDGAVLTIVAEMGRGLTDALARAIALGDGRAARMALAALTTMVAELPDASGISR